MAKVLSVEGRGGGRWRCTYEDVFGDDQYFYVSASDELGAYTEASKQLRDLEMNIRILILSVAALISLGFVTAWVSRIQQTKQFEVCLAAGKQYVSENDGYSCK